MLSCKELKTSRENFIVLPYSVEQFKEILLAFSDISIENLNEKLENRYFSDYFNRVDTQTIVIEKEYVNKDFLDDYANYYVKCFKHYNRFCTRLHFFNKPFTIKKINNLILKNCSNYESSVKDFQDSYLGFIVIKHLPKSIIGKTCLKTYPIEKTGRNFPVLRNYDIHLCGIPLKIKTLAFQEQDHVVAACATSALWSIFQGTGKLFHHTIPSPYEITKNATIDSPANTRTFPNNGLSLEMMAKAIKKISLEPLFISTINEDITQAATYAYLKAKMPLLMGFTIQNKLTKKIIGKHAVALTGYRIESDKTSKLFKWTEKQTDYGILLRSSKVSKVYAHDDQVGPFARMNFGEQTIIPINNENVPRFAMSTSWGMNGKTEVCYAIPEALLIPTYHKIRIPFEHIFGQIYEFNNIIKSFVPYNNDAQKVFSNLEWDIYLTTVNDLKADIINNSIIDKDEKIRICKTNYPRFIWRSTISLGNTKLIDFLFDATDIEQNEYIFDIIAYNKEFLKVLKVYSAIYYDAQHLCYTNNIIIKYLSAINYC